MSVRFEVDLYGPHGAGFELDRLMEGPGPETIMRMEAALSAGTVQTEARAHVITGFLKSSVHSESSFDGDTWSGVIDAARYPGIYELARANTPTQNHPEGGHYFFDPGGPYFLHEVRQAVWDWVTSDHGGPAPAGHLGPFSGA